MSIAKMRMWGWISGNAWKDKIMLEIALNS